MAFPRCSHEVSGVYDFVDNLTPLVNDDGAELACILSRQLVAVDDLSHPSVQVNTLRTFSLRRPSLSSRHKPRLAPTRRRCFCTLRSKIFIGR